MVPGDASYPELLGQIPSPPPILFALGPDDLVGPTVAIVGPRKASGYGLQKAGELACGLVHAGFVSSAEWLYGVDAAAHKAALTAGGRTLRYWVAGRMCLIPETIPGFTARSANAGDRFRSATGLSAV